MIKLDRNSKNICEKLLFRTSIRFRHALRHLSFFARWIVLAVLTGVICGLAGTAFHYALSLATAWFRAMDVFLYLLPAAGVLIVFSYRFLRIYRDEGTNSILRAARAEDTSAFRVGPLIFLATFLTHLCGGSAGREGAALQIGGSLGSFFSRRLKLNTYDHQLMVMCGMSAAFSALFATPLAAAFLSIEIAGVGTVFYAGLVPAVLASFIAMLISRNLGVQPLVFLTAPAQTAEPSILLKILVFASLIGLLSILFCSMMHNTSAVFQRLFPNPYLRVMAGGVLVVILTLLLGTEDYNGTGIPMISRALSGQAPPEAFFLKLLMTAITLGCGFKGGEIVPAFFVGAAFGCTAGAVLGIDPVFAAELGLVGLFCGVVNCPVTSVFLSVELFGSSNFLMFGMTAAVSYLLSGYYSLYSGQKFMNSKLMPVVFERSAK